MRKYMGMLTNWYRLAQADQSLRTVTAKRNIPLWLGWALVAILMGSSIENTVRRYNLTPEQKRQLEMSLKEKDLLMDLEREVRDARLKQHDLAFNPANVQNASNPYFYGNLPSPKSVTQPAPSVSMPRAAPQPVQPEAEETKFDLNEFIKHIIHHERLLPKQTPFRITNPSMKYWKHILGFPIEHNSKVPARRKNFIFLKNPQDVFPAVKKLFEEYASNPTKYGLSEDATIRDAIQVFDQTNSENKIEYLTKTVPGFDADLPLKKIL